MTPQQKANMQAELNGIQTTALKIKSSADALQKARQNNVSNTIKNILSNELGVSKGITSSEQYSSSDSTFDNIISSMQQANTVAQTGIKAHYQRLENEAQHQGNINTSEENIRNGIAINTGALQQLKDNTQRQIKDLDLREQEALASGQIQLATQIGNLKLQKMEFEQKVTQEHISNLLQLGRYFQVQHQNALEDTRNKLNFLSSNKLLGSLSPDAQKNLETQYGLPQGILSKLPSNKKYTTQYVKGIGVGYMSYDKNGKPTSFTLIQGEGKTTNTNGIENYNLVQHLQNMGIGVGVIDKNGNLKSSVMDRVLNTDLGNGKKIPQDFAYSIWDSIKSGHSINDIKQNILQKYISKYKQNNPNATNQEAKHNVLTDPLYKNKLQSAYNALQKMVDAINNE